MSVKNPLNKLAMENKERNRNLSIEQYLKGQTKASYSYVLTQS